MKEYVCVVTSELGKLEDNFVVSITFHSSELSAVRYGMEQVKEISEYPALADFYIYKLLS